MKDILADIVADQFCEQIFHEALADGTVEDIELPLHGGHFLCKFKIEFDTEIQEEPDTPIYSNLFVTVYGVSYMDFEDNERFFSVKPFEKKLAETYKSELSIK